MTTTTVSSCCKGTDVAEINAPALAENNVKEVVRATYARAATRNGGCGCGCGDKSGVEDVFIGDAYDSVEGYRPEADLGLGCGTPTDHTFISEGQAVLDLGSGGGIDAFIARQKVGETGRVTGLDFTPEMIALAKQNAQKLGYSNVDFVHGDIEEMPLPDQSYDVVLSNCVINLVPDKARAFREVHRVLRPGGRFSISDIVLSGDLPRSIRDSVAMYAACVSGATSLKEYLQLIEEAGFQSVSVASRREIPISDADLGELVNTEDARTFRASGGAIMSVTVTAQR